MIDVGFLDQLKAGRVEVLPALVALTRTGVSFADGTEHAFDVVVAATGFATGLEQLVQEPGALDERGYPLPGSAPPGLFFAGYSETPRGQLFESNRRSRRLAAEVDDYLGDARVTLPQPIKFLIVGAAGFVVNLAVFALLYELGVPYLADSIASYAISNALMYIGNRYFTFALGHEGFWPAYARYAIVGTVIVGLNAAVLAVLVEIAGLHPTLGQAVSLIVLTPVAFYLNKRWTFQL